MEAHQRLDVFLPKLGGELVRRQISEQDAHAVCQDILDGNPPGPISTPDEYVRAWHICDAMQEILTTLDDGSEAAAWCGAIAHRIFAYQDQFKAEHGCMPLDPGPVARTNGPSGTA